MSTPLSLTYNSVALHSSGTVTVVSQSGRYSPDSFPQTEERTIRVRLETWASTAGYNYDTLYTNITTIRNALKAQNKILKWDSPGASGAGTTQFQRPAIVVEHNLPDDPNAWGVWSQVIEITFKVEFNVKDASNVLTAVMADALGDSVDLGQVHAWKEDYKNDFYSEWKDLRRRSSGILTASGEILYSITATSTDPAISPYVAAGGASDGRLALALAHLTSLRSRLQTGRYVTLTYANGASEVFDHVVRIDNFTCDIDQGPYTGKIKWNLSASYTIFPEEAAHAGAEITSTLSEDREGGRDTLTLSGRVVAASETLAMAKYTSLVSTMLTAYGFASTDQSRNDVTRQWLNVNDTQGEGDDTTLYGGTAAEMPVEKTAFLELTFNLTYDKKAASILSYSLTISDADDAKTGLLTTTYSGWVVASGASEAAAYTAALAQARTLGNDKYAFRVSYTEARTDRQKTEQSAAEFIRLEFSYVYQRKGTKVYAEVNASTSAETFGETTMRVSGYVVAETLAEAETYYTDNIKATYSAYITRNETTDEREERIEYGVGMETMGIRFDFGFTVFVAKATGTKNFKYQLLTNFDYVNLTQNTKVSGVFIGSAANYAYEEALDRTASNPLWTFVNSFVATYGSMTSFERGIDKELVNSTTNASATPEGIPFTATYQKAMTTTASILQCEIEEDTTYSGTRWKEQPIPTGASTFQDCGTTAGTRVVTGTVTAATEAAANLWIATQYSSGVWAVWRDSEDPGDANRYEDGVQITTRFVFLPLSSGTVGTIRGSGATGGNFQAIQAKFRFSERVPSLTWVMPI